MFYVCLALTREDAEWLSKELSKAVQELRR